MGVDWCKHFDCFYSIVCDCDECPVPCNENLQRRAEEVEEVTCKDLAVEEKHTTYTEMAGAASLSKKDGSIEMTPLASSKE